MHTQPDLFSKMCGTVRTRQPKLFDTDGPTDSGLSCECGEPMVRTASGFICCPRGCGKLYEQANDPRHWEGDTEDLFTTDEGE